MTLVMGVDSSTQSCKVVIVDADTGRVVREGRAPHPDGTSVDPEAWWAALQAAVELAGGMSDVAAWSIGGQQHGLVALDEQGAVVRDALLWNDTRSAQAASDLVAEFGAERLAERTGLVPVASFTISKLRWLRDHEPQNAGRTAAVALPHDWLTWRLRGFGPAADGSAGAAVLGELVTDRSDASGTGYWSAVTGEYDRELLVSALGHDVVVPRVLAADEWVEDRAGRRVAAGAGDNAASARDRCDRNRRGLRLGRRSPSAARVHAQRGTRARRGRGVARGRPRRAVAAGAVGRSRCGRADPRAVLRG
ncbi:MAG: xylulokinase [Microbacterium sp.]|nr:xylulokinase [Microbacterium sp.]